MIEDLKPCCPFARMSCDRIWDCLRCAISSESYADCSVKAVKVKVRDFCEGEGETRKELESRILRCDVPL